MDSTRDLSEHLRVLESDARRTHQKMRAWRNVAYGSILLVLAAPPLRAISPQGKESLTEVRGLQHRVEYLETQLQKVLSEQTAAGGLVQRVEMLESKLVHVTSDADSVTITGANLRVVNGLGSTTTTNGLGNVIVGYNELRDYCLPGRPQEECVDERTGSHNLIVGSRHNYSSYGGAAIGFNNWISGIFSSVTGGVSNAARGQWTSVSGGVNNVSEGVYAAVSGGVGNIASGGISSISGGSTNLASGDYSSISGGSSSEARGRDSWLAGGANNLASGQLSAISGGRSNTALGNQSSVSGGYGRTAPGENDWVGGTFWSDD